MEKTSVDATCIFEDKGAPGTDSTEGVFDFLENLTNHLQENFDDIIGEDNNEKRFIKALTRILELLLNTNFKTTDKINRILRIAIETTLKIWQGPN